MTRSSAFRMLLAALTLSLPNLPSIAQAQDAVRSDRRLPKETFVYLSAPSVKELKTRWGQSGGGKLWTDPAFADFGADVSAVVKDKVAEGLQLFEDEVGVSAIDLLSIPSGEVSFAISRVKPNKLAFGVFLNFGSSGDTVRKLIEKGEEAAADKGLTRNTEEVDDTEIVTYSRESENDGPRSRGGQSLSWCIKDTTLILSNETNLISDVLSRWDGSSDDSFAANDVYAYTMSRCSDDDRTPAIIWYVSPIELFTNVVQTGAAGQAAMGAGMVLGFLPVLGLDKFKAIGGTADIAVGDYEAITRTMIYVDEPTSGVLNMFKFDSTEHTPPKWVPANAMQYVTLQWRVSDAFNAVRQLADIQGPGMFDATIEQLANDENGPMIHIKNDVIDQLTGRIHFVSDMRDKDEFGSDRALAALGCKDEGAIRDVLAKLAETPGAPLQTRDFEATTIYEFSIPNPQGGTMNGGLAVGNGNLNIASDVTLLEQVLRQGSGTENLVGSDEYQEIASRFPNTSAMIAFQRQEDQIRALYETVRNGNVADLVQGIPGDATEFLNQFDFSKLPEFEALKKYLPPSGGWMEADEHGAYGVSFSLKSDD